MDTSKETYGDAAERILRQLGIGRDGDVAYEVAVNLIVRELHDVQRDTRQCIAEERAAQRPPRLAEIRARCEAAPPGPWVMSEPDWDLCPDCAEAGEHKDGCGSCEIISSAEVTKIFTVNCGDYHGLDTPAADFIAHARQDVPDLLDEVERLTQERDAAVQAKEAAEGRGAELKAALFSTLGKLEAANDRLQASEQESAALRARLKVVSSTYGDIPDFVQRMIEPHVWDNMTASEQRDWLLGRFKVGDAMAAFLELTSDHLGAADLVRRWREGR